jgi:hypothetical protein
VHQHDGVSTPLRQEIQLGSAGEREALTLGRQCAGIATAGEQQADRR